VTGAARGTSPFLTLREVLPSLPGGETWTKFRAAAHDRLVTLGLPTPRDDGFRYANLRALERRDLRPAANQALATDGSQALPLTDCHSILVIDGRVRHVDREALLADGIRLELVAERIGDAAPEDLGIDTPGDAADDRLRLWAASVLADGVRLTVAAGSRVARAVRILYTSSGGGSYPRLSVRLEHHAELLLVEEHREAGLAEAVALLVSDLELGEGARLGHVRLDDAGSKTSLLEDSRVRLARDASYRHHSYGLGAALSRLDLTVTLAGPGAATDLSGLSLVDGGRQAHVRTRVIHAAPSTSSTQSYRAIAGQRSKASYDGKVVVASGADGSSSRQSSRNLLLAADAEVDTRPQLEIYTDDVVASHGATTGTLDEDMLFYLRARGIDDSTARGLLTYAFAADVIRGVPLPELKALLGRRVAGLLPEADLLKEFVA
jgi:Fe-S cluster assembly protein SufD